MTTDATALRHTLAAIYGRGYGPYTLLTGFYDLGPCRLIVDHVQVDPYAPPSLMNRPRFSAATLWVRALG